MTLNVQFLTMVSMIAGGFYLGIAFDTYRRISHYWKNNPFLVYFMEVGFWFLQIILLYYILFQVNSGELRVYVFVACLLGYSIYQVIASGLYNKFLEQIIRITISTYHLVSRVIYVLIVAPIKWIIAVLIAIILFIVQMIFSIVLFIGKIVFAPIKWGLVRVYYVLPKKIQKILHKFVGLYSIMKNIYTKILQFIKFKRR